MCVMLCDVCDVVMIQQDTSKAIASPRGTCLASSVPLSSLSLSSLSSSLLPTSFSLLSLAYSATVCVSCLCLPSHLTHTPFSYLLLVPSSRFFSTHYLICCICLSPWLFVRNSKTAPISVSLLCLPITTVSVLSVAQITFVFLRPSWRSTSLLSK
jgi:hypothetical protein